MNYIIGGGGVGSWLTPSLCLLDGARNVTVIDGDLLEDKNLNRQLFTEHDIGENKATALAKKYKCSADPQWFRLNVQLFRSSDRLLVCVDNNPARRDALRACDMFGCMAIFAANEKHSSEAYAYLSAWRGTNLDPREYYPELETDTTLDPRGRDMGCTGENQVQNPQLVSANMMASALAQHLFVVWAMEGPKLEPETQKHLPHKLVVNLSRIESFKATLKERKETPCQQTTDHKESPLPSSV